MPLLLVPHASLEGEILATAVPRDLMRGGFGEPISVLSRYPEVWQHNRFVRDVFTDQAPPGHVVIQLPQPDYNEAAKWHVLLQLMEAVSGALGKQYKLTELRPHLVFSDDEKLREDAPGFMKGNPYWCMCTTLDPEWPTCWWATSMWQQVTHVLSCDPKFPLVLQIGLPGGHTPSVRNCLSLTDRVTLREMIWLISHASGTLSGPGPIVHLAAACLKPSVVVVGGALTPQTCAYDVAAIHCARPHMSDQFGDYTKLLPPSVVFDTIGQLPCCPTYGCGRTSLHMAHESGCVALVHTTKPGGRNYIQPTCLTVLPYSRVAESARAMHRSQA